MICVCLIRIAKRQAINFYCELYQSEWHLSVMYVEEFVTLIRNSIFLDFTLCGQWLLYNR